MATLDLRPLSLGELLDRTFFLYRRHFLLFIGLATIPYLAVIGLFVGVAVLFAITARMTVRHSEGFPSAPGIAAFVIAGVLAVAFFLLAYAISNGASNLAVSEMYAQRGTTIRKAYGLLRGRIAAVIWVSVLGFLIMAAGFLALIIPGIYLACRLSVAIPAMLFENLSPWDSIRRSFQLTKDFAGRVFLIFLLTVALTWGVAMIFKIPFLLLAAVNAHDPRLVTVWTVLSQTGNLLGNALIAPVSTIAFALFYYDLRVRKEAFDLQMMMQAIGADPAPPAITGGVPSAFGRDAS